MWKSLTSSRYNRYNWPKWMNRSLTLIYSRPQKYRSWTLTTFSIQPTTSHQKAFHLSKKWNKIKYSIGWKLLTYICSANVQLLLHETPHGKKSLLRKLMKIEYFTRKLPKHKVNWILHWYSNPGVLTREKPAFMQEWVLRHGGIQWAKIFLKSILIMLTLVLSLNMYFNTTPSFPYSIWKQFPVHHFELKLLQIRVWERK